MSASQMTTERPLYLFHMWLVLPQTSVCWALSQLSHSLLLPNDSGSSPSREHLTLHLPNNNLLLSSCGTPVKWRRHLSSHLKTWQQMTNQSAWGTLEWKRRRKWIMKGKERDSFKALWHSCADGGGGLVGWSGFWCSTVVPEPHFH